MQLSTSTPSSDSNLLGFLPVSAGQRSSSLPEVANDPAQANFAELLATGERPALPLAEGPNATPLASTRFLELRSDFPAESSAPAVTDSRAFQTLLLDVSNSPGGVMSDDVAEFVSAPNSPAEPAIVGSPRALLGSSVATHPTRATKESVASGLQAFAQGSALTAPPAFGSETPLDAAQSVTDGDLSEDLRPSPLAHARLGAASSPDQMAAENAAAQMNVPVLPPIAPAAALQFAAAVDEDRVQTAEAPDCDSQPFAFASTPGQGSERAAALFAPPSVSSPISSANAPFRTDNLEDVGTGDSTAAPGGIMRDVFPASASRVARVVNSYSASGTQLPVPETTSDEGFVVGAGVSGPALPEIAPRTPFRGSTAPAPMGPMPTEVPPVAPRAQPLPSSPSALPSAIESWTESAADFSAPTPKAMRSGVQFATEIGTSPAPVVPPTPVAPPAQVATGRVEPKETRPRAADSKGEAISAGIPSAGNFVVESAFSSRAFKFLTNAEDGLKDEATGVGTAVAKSSPNMAAASSLLPSTPVEAPAPTANAHQAASARSLTQAETLAAAHRAVDAVLATTERFTPSTQSVANLKLAVGDSELAVRVEVRGGEIHATFRTDSPELRAALSHEWRSAAMQPAEQPLRLAAPVFASSERSLGDHSAGYSGEQPAQGREQPARPNPEFVLPGSFRGKSASASHGGETTATAPALRVLPSTTQHLHAFA